MSPKALSDLDGVPLAEDFAGPTVSARMQASGLDQLGRWWSRIQIVDGVIRTLTCTVLQRQPCDTPAPPRVVPGGAEGI
jgi:hypothetical protein